MCCMLTLALAKATTTTVDRIDQLNDGADALGNFAATSPELFVVILAILALVFGSGD